MGCTDSSLAWWNLGELCKPNKAMGGRGVHTGWYGLLYPWGGQQSARQQQQWFAGRNWSPACLVQVASVLRWCLVAGLLTRPRRLATPLSERVGAAGGSQGLHRWALRSGLRPRSGIAFGLLVRLQ